MTRMLCGRDVPGVGLGAMPLSWPEMVGERDRAIATVHAALDAGCRHIDTSNIYAPGWQDRGHNELLVAEAINTWDGDTSALVLATKGGLVAAPEGMGRDGSPAGLRAACEESRSRLGVESIDLYYLHRADPTVSFQSQVETLEALRVDGLIRAIGLSNVSSEQLRFAHELAPIAAVQNEWSPRFRDGRDVLDLCGELKMAFVAWSPFGGADRASDVASQYAAFGDVGAAHGCSAYRVALAWLLAQGDHVLAIPGSTRPVTILDSLAAIDVKLSKAEIERLDATVPEGTSQYPDDMAEIPPLRSTG
ncbi:MAG: aldo/keto reductase [Ilumatobacter sp.]